jgi:hypothetical protein
MLFIQSLTYNLTKGDDGTCERMKSEGDCFSLASAYQTGESRCYWDVAAGQAKVSGSCHYIQPGDSIYVIVFVAVFSALLSTPIAAFLDWVIIHVLSASTTNEAATVHAGLTASAEANGNLPTVLQKKQQAKQSFDAMFAELIDYRNQITDSKQLQEFNCKSPLIVQLGLSHCINLPFLPFSLPLLSPSISPCICLNRYLGSQCR